MLKDRFKEAMVLHRAGAVEQAEAIYRDLLREDPEHAGAWHLLGVVLHSRHDLCGALEHIEKALSLCDFKATYWNNCGVVLKDLGRHREAKEAFEKAISIHDDYPDAWSNLGLMQTELGRLDEAEKSIRYALRLEPRHADALRHLAIVYRDRGEFDEALRLCRDAAAVAPGMADVYDILGTVLAAMKRFEEAAAAYDKALSLDSSAAETYLNQGLVYTELDETQKARQSFNRAAEIRRDRPMWRLRYLGLCPVIFQTADEIREYRAELDCQLDEALADPPPFDWQSAIHDGFMPSFQLSHHGVCNRRIKEKFARLFAPHFPQQCPEPGRRSRIRVGFICTRTHEGGFVRGFGGIMERLDRKRFEVVGLVSRGILPFCRKLIRSEDITWIGIPHQMEAALAVFRQAGCDVVMHWTPGTDLMNYFLPFLPLAPVQCIGFGMHGTTGIGGIDYCISSKLFERGEDSAEDYTERLVQFESSTCWQVRPPLTPKARRADFGLPASGTLCFCPQRLAKFHPDFDRVLRRILERVPSTFICVLSGTKTRSSEALRQRFDRTLGASLAKRLLFLPAQNAADYQRLVRVMDVVLDMPNYSAAWTGYDALGADIPIITLPGSLMVARYAKGLYEQMKFRDLIASDETEYVDLAVRLCRDGDFRRAISGQIRNRSHVLFENELAIREYETFFERVNRERS